MIIFLSNAAAIATIVSTLLPVCQKKRNLKDKQSENLSAYKEAINGLLSQMKKEVELASIIGVEGLDKKAALDNLFEHYSNTIFDSQTIYALRKNPISSSPEWNGVLAREINDKLHEIEKMLRKKVILTENDYNVLTVQYDSILATFDLIESRRVEILQLYEEMN